MIESRLDPLTDGTGGGYGNYPGLNVAEIAGRFRVLAAEGHDRSARAILRIVHEQTAARGTLGAQRLLAILSLVVTLVLLGLRLGATSEASRAKLGLYLAAAGVATILFGIGAASVERTARRNAAQIREIRRLALLALERVVETEGFVAKPLEREHRRSLGEMRRGDPTAWERVASRFP